MKKLIKSLVISLILTITSICLGQTNVYSGNIVGYAVVPINQGFSMIYDPFDFDGTGTNNSVDIIFSNMLNGVTIMAYNGNGYDTAGYATKTGWSGNTNAINNALNNLNIYGNGFFVKFSSNTNIILLGNVLQGTLTRSYTNGFNIIGSPVPQEGLLQTDLGFIPNNNDTIYRYKSDQSGYITAGYSTKLGWQPNEPKLNVGEAFFLKNTTGGGIWIRNFTIPQ